MGVNLRRFRSKRGLSLERFAQRSGVSRAMLSQLRDESPRVLCPVYLVMPYAEEVG